MDIDYKFEVVTVMTWPMYKGVPDFVNTVVVGCTASLGEGDDRREIRETRKIAIFQDGDDVPDSVYGLSDLVLEEQHATLLSWAITKMESTEVPSAFAEFVGDTQDHMSIWKAKIRNRLLTEIPLKHTKRNRQAIPINPEWTEHLKSRS